MEIKNIEECKRYIQEKLEKLRPLFAKAAIGDFSENAPDPKDDELDELYVGLQTMIEAVRAKIADLEAEAGQRQVAEERLIAKNKEQREIQKAMMNVLEDLQKAKADSERNEAKYAALINSVGDGIVATDNNGLVIFTNNVFENLLGWSNQELMNKRYVDYVKLEDENGQLVDVQHRLLNEAMSFGKTVSSSAYYYIKKSGVKFPVSITVSPIFLVNKVVGSISIVKDITNEPMMKKKGGTGRGKSSAKES